MCSRSFVYCIFIARWFAQHQPQYLRFALGWRKRNNIFAISISLISSGVILIDFIFLAFQAFYPIDLSALQFILFLVLLSVCQSRGLLKSYSLILQNQRFAWLSIPTFQRRINVVSTSWINVEIYWCDVENETKSNFGFSTLHNFDKQRW